MNRRISITYTILSILFIVNVIHISSIALLSEDLSDVTTHTNQNIVDTRNPYFYNSNQNLTRIIFEMYMEILPNGEDVSVKSQFTYQNSGLEEVTHIIHYIDLATILTSSRISSITVYDAFGDLNYKWDILESEQLVNISLREGLLPQEFYSFTIEYLLEKAISSQVDLVDSFILQWTVTHDEDIEQFSVVLTLPSIYSLFNQSGLDPEPDYKSTDERRFEWNFYNVKSNQEHTWIVRFKIYQEPTITQNDFNQALWIAGLFIMFIVGITTGSIGVYYLQKSKTDTERTEIVESLLSKPEKQILKIVQEKEGVTTQNKITEISGFSKAKVSYYLTELEKKDIIKRERWGRMNRIRIIDDSFDKVLLKEDEEE